MRRPTIAYMDNGLPVQCLSERDFLFPDADEKYVPDARAYIHDTDVGTLNRPRGRKSLRRSPICLTLRETSTAGPSSTSGRTWWHNCGASIRGPMTVWRRLNRVLQSS
jgi:hypothetical protein